MELWVSEVSPHVQAFKFIRLNVSEYAHIKDVCWHAHIRDL